jgi:hypothetical protein
LPTGKLEFGILVRRFCVGKRWWFGLEIMAIEIEAHDLEIEGPGIDDKSEERKGSKRKRESVDSGLEWLS